VALDLYRPVGLIGWYWAGDLGRAAYHLLTRGLAPTLVGAVLFDLTWPPSAWSWLAFALSLPLAVSVSFTLRFLVAASAFWVLDASGARMLSGVLAMFFSGMVLPLVLFPGALGTLAMALPWASFVQVPADLWLGQRTGADAVLALAFQLGWLLALLAVCSLVLRAATRKVVVQGG
jgi:viologen exporter family transport system permease protein